jgi:hypothetical protein
MEPNRTGHGELRFELEVSVIGPDDPALKHLLGRIQMQGGHRTRTRTETAGTACSPSSRRFH